MNGMMTRARSLAHDLRRRASVLRQAPNPSAQVHMMLEIAAASAAVEPPSEVVFREVRGDVVREHPRRYASYGIDADVRLARGDRCYAGSVAGRVVFRMWVSTNNEFIRRRSEKLGRLERAAYVYDSFTEPDWRGRSIRGASLTWLAGVMASDVDRLVLSVDADNLPSIRAARKAGFREIP
jgi:predicted GNAT family acetyltransferase